MKITLETAPVLFPVSLDEGKKQCEIDDDDTSHDDYIESLIKVATGQAEQYLHRRLITQTWTSYFDGWPDVDEIILPFGKLQSVTTVKYKNSAGVQTTFSSSDYDVDIATEPGRIVLGYEEVWPTATLYPSNPIEIEFVCGYGTDGSDVEPAINHAIKLTISDLFENRETEVYLVNHTKLKTWEALLFPYKLFGGVF